MPSELVRLATEGKSMVQIAAIFGVDKTTMRDWAKDIKKPEFMEAYRLGRTCSEAYWEEVGQRGAKGLAQRFNAPAWCKIMGTRFKDDWAEVSTQKIELKNEFKSMSNEEIDDTIKTLLAQRNLNKTPNDSGAPAQQE